MEELTIYDIVANWIDQNGLNGLRNPDQDCYCLLADLMNCEEPQKGCIACKLNIEALEEAEKRREEEEEES